MAEVSWEAQPKYSDYVEEAKRRRFTLGYCASLIGVRTLNSFEITSDGFVWKNGSRIGWIDGNGPTFYWTVQLTMAPDARPIPKPNQTGQRLSPYDVAREADEYIKSPKDFVAARKPTVEKTGDGFVWSNGARIGWVDAIRSSYFRINQLSRLSEERPVPKPGEVGEPIVSGDIMSAIERSEAAAR